jgi:hypothetical protein
MSRRNAFDKAAARRADIERFAREISIADSDDFPAFLIGWHWHNPKTKDAIGAVMEAARRMGGIITEQQAEAVVEEADSRPKIRDRDELAKYLGLTYAMRKKLDIRTIGACDVSARARKAIQKQERRKREAARRRASGAKCRADFLANSKTREAPWKRCGMSKATWYRRGQPIQVPEPPSTRWRLRQQDIPTASGADVYATLVWPGTWPDESFTVVRQVHAASIREEDGARTCLNGDKGDGARTCLTKQSTVGKFKDRDVRRRVLALLNDGSTRTVKEIVRRAGVRSRSAADGLLHKLVSDGYIERVERGIYRRARVVPDHYVMTSAGLKRDVSVQR